MATTLSSLIDRVEALLMDSTNQVYDTAVITEAIRLALGAYNLARELSDQPGAAISGLDGASSTTLFSPAHDTLLVIGAAGFAACSRSADRSESFDLGGQQAAAHLAWGEQQLAVFRELLSRRFAEWGDPNRAEHYRADQAAESEQSRVSGIRASTEPTFAAWADGQDW